MDKNMKSNNPTDLSLKAFAKSFTVEIFHVDSRIFKTLYALFFKPGHLTLAYFKTSERQYVQPLKLYFVINLIFFLITPILNTPHFRVFSFSMESLTGRNQTYQKIIKEQIQAIDVSEEIYEERFNAHIKYNQPAFVFLVIPFFAFILNMVNFKNKRYYVEHLIFSTHLLSFLLLFLLIIIFLFRFLTFGLKCFTISSGLVGLIIVIAFFIWLLIYLVVATRGFYKNRILTSISKSLILFAGFIVTIGGYTQFLFFYTILALKLGY